MLDGRSGVSTVNAFVFLDRLNDWLGSQLAWVKLPVLASAVIVLLSLFLAFPLYRVVEQPYDWSYQALDWKLEHPLSAIPVDRFEVPSTPYHQGLASHLRKRTYRITLPLLSQLLHLGLNGEINLSFLAGCIFIVVLLFQFREITHDPLAAFLLGIAAGCAFLCQWGTNDSFYFDAVGYLCLAAAAYTQRMYLVALFVVLGGFSDERVILATPLVYLFQQSNLSRMRLADLKPSRRQVGTIAGVLLFLCIRVTLGLHIGNSFDRTEVGLESLPYNLSILGLSLMMDYKGTVLVIGAGFIVLLGMHSGRVAAVAAVCALPVMASSLLVWDLSRTLNYAFPLLLLCTKALAESLDAKQVRRIAVCAAMWSVLLPTHYMWLGAAEHFLPMFRMVRVLRINHWSLRWEPVSITGRTTS